MGAQYGAVGNVLWGGGGVVLFERRIFGTARIFRSRSRSGGVSGMDGLEASGGTGVLDVVGVINGVGEIE